MISLCGSSFSSHDLQLFFHLEIRPGLVGASAVWILPGSRDAIGGGGGLSSCSFFYPLALGLRRARLAKVMMSLFGGDVAKYHAKECDVNERE